MRERERERERSGRKICGWKNGGIAGQRPGDEVRQGCR